MAISKITGNQLRIAGGRVPLMKTIGIRVVPDGSVQSTGYVFSPNTFIYRAILETLIPESTGLTKELNVGFDNNIEEIFSEVSVNVARLTPSTDIDPQTGIQLSQSTELDRTVFYQARSNDWAEFNGLIHIQYYNFS